MKRKTLFGFARNETGAVAPLVGIMIVLFIGCLALVVDLGMLHNVKVQLQRAADAAALAGAMQLDGGGDQGSRAEVAARAAAAANRVQGDTGFVATGGWVGDDNVIPVVGNWNPDVSIPLEDPEDHTKSRFQSSKTPINAVKVTAYRDVQHIFALVFRIFNPGTSNSTRVRADAIAVADFEEPGIPIALLSCIPMSEGMGSSVCDVSLYFFNRDNLDTAGWTTLTKSPVNAATLQEMFSEDGIKIFNNIMYGTDASHSGLENERVKRNCYRDNIDSTGTNITCGLGPDFDPSVSSSGDPLLYYPSLPRWDDATHFNRIWTMDGQLSQQPGEIDVAYVTRLQKLRTGDYSVLTIDREYLKDGRFARYIDEDIKLTNKGEVDLSAKKMRQLLNKMHQMPLKEAGYPVVLATNGVANAVIQKLIDMVAEDRVFKGSETAVNAPLNETAATSPHVSYGGGETISVTVPIIFAGQCPPDPESEDEDTDAWDALGEHFYIGRANLLLTRLWQNPTAAACNQAGNPVQVFPGHGCGSFSPPLDGDRFACGPGPSGGGMEGMIVPKGKKDEETGVKRVYLVE